MKRPDFIKHHSEIQEPANSSYYRGSGEFLSQGSPFSKAIGLSRIGIHHEVLPPGRRTSWPHAESAEEEFVYVIEGNPDVWINGDLYPLRAGDAVGFPPGTGISHTFINNSEHDVRLLVVGEASKKENKVYYPLHPVRREICGDMWWKDVPHHDHGSHDGLPDRLRGSEALGPLNFTGEIIVESLKDPSLLVPLETYRIKTRRVQPSGYGPWTVNRYCVDEKTLIAVLPLLESALRPEEWYMHFVSDLGNDLYVVFAGRHFKIAKKKDQSWGPMIEYGESIGVGRRWTENIPINFQGV